MDTSPSTPKSLRKQRSLQKLFSLSKRKGSRSRAPSTEQSNAPSPPAVPDQFLPSSPTNRGPSITSSETFVSSQTKRSRESLSNECYDSKEFSSPLGEPNEGSRDTKSNGFADTRYGMQIRSSPNWGYSNAVQEEKSLKPLIPTSTSNIEAEKPRLPHKSPTDPILPKRAQRSLQTPAIPLAVNRDRGASTSSHRPQPRSRKVSIPLRPSTAAELGPRLVQDDNQSEFPYIHSAPLMDASPDKSVLPIAREHQAPWQALYNQDEVRTSFRSALTTSSIYQETGSTERSSVLTRESSLSNMTVDYIQRPTSKAGSMTVDDAIGMYAAGFTDDIDSRSINSRISSSKDEVRRSLKIAEAMNENIGSELLMPPRFPSLGLRDSTDIMSGDLFDTGLSQQPPPIMPPTTTRDQYGFRKKTHHITVEDYDSWHANYMTAQDRRTRKWTTFMRDQGLSVDNPVCFPARGAKVQRYIRKGIPASWRGSVWFYYAGGDTYLLKHQGLYDSLLARSQTSELSETEKETIERDLHRTFPDNIHFKSDDPLADFPEPRLLSSLRHLLYAFALHHPRIGYCQSLNFLAGLLLLFLPEEKAFWMLHIITTSYLPGTHEISLEGANVDLWVLMLALKETMPAIFAKIGDNSGDSMAATATASSRLPPVSLCATSWFMSLFIGNLPIETVLRVWDVLFYEGSRTIFRVALAVFKIGEREIRNVSDPMEIFQVVQALPRGLLDAGGLVGLANRRGVGVGQAWVERKRAERREWYKRERARKGGGGGVDAEHSGDGLVPMTMRGRTDSGWRRKVGLGR